MKLKAFSIWSHFSDIESASHEFYIDPHWQHIKEIILSDNESRVIITKTNSSVIVFNLNNAIRWEYTPLE